jgi:mannose-6-phosphate isomerase
MQLDTPGRGQVRLYPLRFDPIYEYRPWGGRRLGRLLGTPLPDGPVGEAWILSDRDDHPSRVAEGPLQGRTIAQLLEDHPEQMMGRLVGRFARFPLLLKFLDVRQMLSVQVHPSDSDADFLPAGETGKTEAWVVIRAAASSRIYAGLQPGTRPGDLRQGLADADVEACLSSFIPARGEAVLVPAGTVHSLGGDIVVLEVQQNSDVTFRLYDWDHVDPRTGQLRPLQVDQALACIDVGQGAVGPVAAVLEAATPVRRERLIVCDQFGVWRLHGDSPFSVGATGVPRVLVCLEGAGAIDHGGASPAIGRGDVLLLPAVLGQSVVRPRGAITLLEIALPDELSRDQPPAAHGSGDS